MYDEDPETILTGELDRLASLHNSLRLLRDALREGKIGKAIHAVSLDPSISAQCGWLDETRPIGDHAVTITFGPDLIELPWTCRAWFASGGIVMMPTMDSTRAATTADLDLDVCDASLR